MKVMNHKNDDEPSPIEISGTKKITFASGSSERFVMRSVSDMHLTLVLEKNAEARCIVLGPSEDRKSVV